MINVNRRFDLLRGRFGSVCAPIISSVNLGMAFNMAALEGRGGCLCDEVHFESQAFFSRDGVLRGEFEL